MHIFTFYKKFIINLPPLRLFIFSWCGSSVAGDLHHELLGFLCSVLSAASALSSCKWITSQTSHIMTSPPAPPTLLLRSPRSVINLQPSLSDGSPPSSRSHLLPLVLPTRFNTTQVAALSLVFSFKLRLFVCPPSLNCCRLHPPLHRSPLLPAVLWRL